MLSLYWQPDESDLVRAAAGKVWADHLERFSQDEIAKACRRWIGKESRRPTPAEIIKLCCDARPKPVLVPPPRKPHPRDTMTPEERAASQAMFERLIQDLNRKAGMAYGPVIKRVPRSGDE